jgi:carbonic anhydrase/acetyltransferase-like protein (isoleucine patch superfamily)
MGADIGDYCVVGAGAIVTERTVAPPHRVLIGVPARVIENAAHRFA